MTTPKEPRSVDRDEWLKEGERRFGEDMRTWGFLCPNCKGVQTVSDFLVLRDELKVQVNPEQAYNSCIGRFDPRIPVKDVGTIGDGKSPCDYTNGGLFCFNTLVVVTEGKEIPCFEFAGGIAPGPGSPWAQNAEK